jgi:hypothetical protein
MFTVNPVWVHVPAISASNAAFAPDAAIWRCPDVVPSAFRLRTKVLPASISFLWPPLPVVTKEMAA